MGCFCSCFRVPEVEEEVNVSNNQNYAPLCYLTQIFKNKYGVVPSNDGLQTAPSSAQGSDIATTEDGTNTPQTPPSSAQRDITTTEVGTNTPQGTSLQNSSRSQNLELQRYVAITGNGADSGPLQVDHRPREGHNVRVNLCTKSSDNAGGFSNDKKDEARRSASPVNVSSKKVEPGHRDSSWSSEDECPTCYYEYTPENPKIISQCNHHFHLGCIYEWMERKPTCPICSREMKFAENSSTVLITSEASQQKQMNTLIYR